MLNIALRPDLNFANYQMGGPHDGHGAFGHAGVAIPKDAVDPSLLADAKTADQSITNVVQLYDTSGRIFAAAGLVRAGVASDRIRELVGDDANFHDFDLKKHRFGPAGEINCELQERGLVPTASRGNSDGAHPAAAFRMVSLGSGLIAVNRLLKRFVDNTDRIETQAEDNTDEFMRTPTDFGSRILGYYLRAPAPELLSASFVTPLGNRGGITLSAWKAGHCLLQANMRRILVETYDNDEIIVSHVNPDTWGTTAMSGELRPRNHSSAVVGQLKDMAMHLGAADLS